jgi:hypothetical protein
MAALTKRYGLKNLKTKLDADDVAGITEWWTLTGQLHDAIAKDHPKDDMQDEPDPEPEVIA